MDLDTNELDRYLANVGGYSPADLAAAAAATTSPPSMDSSMPVSMPEGAMQAGGMGPNGRGRLGAENSPISGSEMMGAADMDSIVAESTLRELRRRSLANPGGSFGIDYLSVGDDVNPYSMVSPTFADASMSRMASIPTTMEDLMVSMSAPTASDLSMMYGDDGETGSMSMFGEPPSMLPSSSQHQDPNHLSASMSQSPMAPRPTSQLSRGSSGMSINSNGSVAMNKPQMPMSMDTSPQMNGQETEHRPVPSIFPENIYSSSGFDMLDILNRVANRPNPQINIGAVDMSCAFVVIDVRKFDHPIVYCSATFERLTGYTKHEVLGRNCRFLQAPDGKITPGEKRKYVDENAVYYLKTRIAERQEAQTSLINYRKGGQSFTNLLTIIPIQYDSPDIVYIVGFQVDLVDQPGAMMNKNRGKDGTFAVNYQYAQLPTYIPTAASLMLNDRPRLMMGRDDVGQVLSSFGTGDSEIHSKRVMDKVLLENTDDVVHVLSLKGLFLYCSPSIRKVLEYEPQELVGTSLSGVCHPSDIVPVTRDLKDTSTGVTVNVVFRIRRKFSGYTWFESHGCLHTEQGKGRKCIILVGRERPVYVLRWKEIQAGGGIGENEVWTKMSTSGMFLYVSSNIKGLLDRESEEMMGTSMHDLMRTDSKHELGKALESARQGNKTTVKHEIQNKRGQFLQAVTTLFPGDGGLYQRPTFLIAQTKLLKHIRAAAATAASPATIVGPPNNTASQTPSSHNSTPSLWSASTPSTRPTTEERSTSAESKDTDGGSNSNTDDNMFEELKTTRSTSWQFELRQMQRTNKRLVEELNTLLASRKKRKRRKGVDQLEKDCANCHTRVTPEWRRGPSGKRDLCNSCGLRYAKLQKIGRDSSRTAPSTSDKGGNGSPLAQQSPVTQHSLTVEMSTTNAPTMASQPKTSQLATIQEPGQSPTQQHAEHPKSSMPLAGSHQQPLRPLGDQGRRGSMGNMPKISLMTQQQQARRRSMGGVVPSPSTSSSSSLTPKQQQPPLVYSSGPPAGNPMETDTGDGGPGG